MTNILEAISNIVTNSNFNLVDLYSGKNRINNVGEALETFVKDAFANTINIEDTKVKIEKYNEVFSWLGNQNHPPDIMIKGSDAIEVKKTQSANSDIALNSSYPKAKLLSSSKMLTSDCKKCEDWDEKDLIYCIGHTSDKELKSLWMIYGNIYAANASSYEVIKHKITTGIQEIPNIELAETNELGRVNRVDPLGITSLRIRGMWHISNPRKVFNYLYQPSNSTFELVVIVPNDKFNSFSQESINKIQGIKDSNFKIEEAKVKDPNNPAKLIEVKLITYVITS
jgi:hypothetical protein